MQRLTKSSKGLMGCDECYNEKSDCGYCESISEAIQKLADYEGLEEQGLLLRLPCKVGDTVYTNTKVVGWHLVKEKRPYEVNVAFIGINEKFAFMNVVYKNNGVFQFEFSEIGKTVFLTKEEAEAKLREVENGD